MLKIVEITNPFESSKNRKINTTKWKGKKLSNYLPVYLDEPIVFVNQKRVYDFDIIPNDNSEIVISPKQKISSIAAGIFSFFTSGGAIATTWATMTVGSALAYVAATAIVMAGSALLSSLLAPQMPNNQIESISESPTYSWESATTMARTGVPVPVLYGKHLLTGNIIQRKIDYIGDDEYLNMLIVLCMGEIEDIENGDIVINNTPISDYEDTQYWFRNGTLTQSTIPYFSDIETPNSFSVDLLDSPIERQTIGNANESIKIFLQFPQGLYYQNDNGGLDTRSVQLKIEYRKVGSSTWINLPKYYRYLDYWECERYNSIKVISWKSTTYVCDKKSPTIWVRCPDERTCTDWFGRTIVCRNQQSLECATGRKRAVYATKVVPWEFSAAQTTSFSRMIEIRDLDPAKYEVRLTRLTSVSTNPRLQTSCKWIGMGEIVYNNLTYPTASLLGLRIKATGQLSNDVTVGVVTQRKQIKVYDENGLYVGYKRLDNPAWVFWDILTNKYYGYGLDYSKLDYPTINEWAEWCDEFVPSMLDGWSEQRYTFNGVFDFEGNIWDALVKVATVGRASPILKGTKYSVVVDKPTVMTQIFNMGNIVKSSLKISYISKEDLANEVEIQFVNEENNYTNDTMTVVMQEWFSTDEIPKKSTINQMGITRPTQAYRAGRYFLNNNANTRRTAEFDVGLDALDSEIGDVIGLSHDVPAWGQSGRVVNATPTNITLDREVVLNSSKEYEITVRHIDDSIETFDVEVSNNETTDEIDILGSFTKTPEKYDIYSIIEKAKGINLFRITSITRKDDFTRSIKAVEYNEKVVSDVPVVYPSLTKSELNINIKVIDVDFKEHLEKKADGTIVPYLEFNIKIDSIYDNAKYAIYLSKDDGNTYKEIARDTASMFTYMALELEENKQYMFKIVAKRKFSNYGNLSQAQPFSYTFLGKKAPPSDVDNFKVSQNGDTLHFSWEEIKDVDKRGYEIREGIFWDSSTVIATNISHNTFDIPATMNGTYEYKIKAIDTSNIYSINATAGIVTVKGVDENLNYIINKSDDFKGILTNLTLVNSLLYLTSSMTDTIVTDENDTFIYDYTGDSPLFCEYETNAIDTLLVGDTSIRIKSLSDTILFEVTDSQLQDRVDNDYPLDTDQHITTSINKTTYISYSDDDVNYSDWEEYKQVINETFRYIKIKIRFEFNITNTRINMEKITYILDVPDNYLTINNFSIGENGEDVVYEDFNKQFYKETNVRVTVLNGGASIAPDITNKTLDGFHIDLYNTDNEKTSGNVDISIQGY